jgi:hypothetical protein
MHDPIPIRREQREARLSYYDRALLHYFEWIQGTMSSMKVDGFSEAAEHLATALLKIEDAWAIVALANSSSMIARKNQARQPERPILPESGQSRRRGCGKNRPPGPLCR